MVNNPHASIPNRSVYHRDTTSSPIICTNSVIIPRKAKLNKYILKNMEYASIRSYLRGIEGTHFYMTATEKDGFSIERFKVLQRLIYADFNEKKHSYK